MAHAQTLAALTSAKLCHDLVNPLGAVGNGIELLQMTLPGPSPEMELISEALEDASARLTLYRVAFGLGESDRSLPGRDIERVLKTLSRGGRIAMSWDNSADSTRAEAKRVFLAMLCAETALPLGGAISYDGQSVTASGPRITCDPALWDPLTAGTVPDDLPSARVMFALLPLTLTDQGRSLTVERSEERVRLTF